MWVDNVGREGADDSNVGVDDEEGCNGGAMREDGGGKGERARNTEVRIGENSPPQLLWASTPHSTFSPLFQYV